MSERINIVVVNDDGWGTAGIRLLAKEMTKLGNVTVIAPDSARSGYGAAISAAKPIYLRRIEEHDLNGAEVYTTNGTPADCVKIAREILFADKETCLSRALTTAATQPSTPCIQALSAHVSWQRRRAFRLSAGLSTTITWTSIYIGFSPSYAR